MLVCGKLHPDLMTLFLILLIFVRSSYWHPNYLRLSFILIPMHECLRRNALIIFIISFVSVLKRMCCLPSKLREEKSIDPPSWDCSVKVACAWVPSAPGIPYERSHCYSNTQQANNTLRVFSLLQQYSTGQQYLTSVLTATAILNRPIIPYERSHCYSNTQQANNTLREFSTAVATLKSVFFVNWISLYFFHIL